MDKLQELTAEQLAERYENQFGLPAQHHDKDTILAAIWYGKRIKYLTEEEINTIQDQY